MKVTYLPYPPTRAGQRVPIQDIQEGEKFRVVSQQGMYIADYLLHHLDPTKFKRRGDHLYTLRSHRIKVFVWQKCVDYYFTENNPNYRWMNLLKSGKATIIVEIY